MSSNPTLSIIIRTKNEEKYLEKVLLMLQVQTYHDFETILIDDNSTDNTINIAKKYNCRTINIPVGKFSHPYSCNLGAENSNGQYLVYINGHSIPTSKKFLEYGLANFQDKKVAGVYSTMIAHKDGSLADKLLINPVGYSLGMLKFKAPYFIPGLLGTNNAIIRKDLWMQYHFNEHFNNGWGGEDSDWARHFMKLGYIFIHDPKYKVRHSHHLKFKELFWQINNYKKMLKRAGSPEKQKRNF
jgi:rhamnosyltransferase